MHLYRVFPAPSVTAYNRRIGGGAGIPGAYQIYSRTESVNFDGNYDDQSLHAMWRLEFEETGKEDGLFLTVLYPTSDSTPMPTVYPIGTSTSGDHIGVEIDSPTGDDILVVFSNRVNEVANDSYALTTHLASPHDVLVVDLADGSYSLDGSRAVTADNNAVFWDSVLLGGAVVIGPGVTGNPGDPNATPGTDTGGSTVSDDSGGGGGCFIGIMF